jgi:hypothetical protein
VLEMKKLEIRERQLDFQWVKQEREIELKKWEIEGDKEMDERQMQLELNKLELQVASGHVLSPAAQHVPSM